MTDKNDGGPAFPHDEKNGDGSHYHSNMGMTRRDYFAAKASQGMHANPACDSWGPEEMARKAYEWADAMLAERAK